MTHSPAPTPNTAGPYAQPSLNRLHHMLFCDELAAFAPQAHTQPTAWQSAIFATPPRLPEMSRWAADTHAESRVRLLACAALRAHGQVPPTRELLGVVVEVPMQAGLDVLAAYLDGSVRYINHSGKVDILEPLPVTQPVVGRLMQAALNVLKHIGPWDQPRLPPPAVDHIRLSFLVSDGLYFGEGPMLHMQRDGLAGPVIQQATALLQLTMNLGARRAA